MHAVCLNKICRRKTEPERKEGVERERRREWREKKRDKFMMSARAMKSQHTEEPSEMIAPSISSLIDTFMKPSLVPMARTGCCMLHHMHSVSLGRKKRKLQLYVMPLPLSALRWQRALVHCVGLMPKTQTIKLTVVVLTLVSVIVSQINSVHFFVN